MNDQIRQPLLVCIGDEFDDEGTYDAALRYATDRARVEGRPLRLVHVVHSPRGLAGSGGALIDFDATELVGEQLLQAAAERTRSFLDGAETELETLAVQGPVVPTLTDLAVDCSAVILQHRVRNRLSEAFTGSVTAGVASRSLVPVVSVPEGWVAGPERPDQRARLIVAIGDTDRDGCLLGHALELGVSPPLSVALVHAWDVPEAYDLTLMSSPVMKDWERRGTEALESLAAPWRITRPDVDLEVRHLRGRPVDVLAEVAREADLLVLGRRHHRLPGHHLGSLPRAMMREAACPVEVVPLEAFAGADPA